VRLLAVDVAQAKLMIEPHYTDDRVTLFHGDCRAVLAAMEPNSVHSVVTDPPYDLTNRTPDVKGCTECGRTLGGSDGNPDVCPRCGGPLTYQRSGQGKGFMGKSWDATGVAFEPATWEAVLRVLKPGGFLVAFGGTRTSHRMVCAIEDAGFEIRDSVSFIWNYSTGFPKSQNVGKAIDKLLGAEREVIGTNPNYRDPDTNAEHHARWNGAVMSPNVTAPASPEATQWDGYGSALKPAVEPIILARKPLDGTIAGNVLNHGAGALNIDACRVVGPVPSVPQPVFGVSDEGVTDFGAGVGRNGEMSSAPKGRFPANFVIGHNPDCERSGTVSFKGAVAVNRNRDATRGPNAPYVPAVNTTEDQGYVDEDGNETADAWVCTPGCPAAELNRQSGVSTSPAGMVKGQRRRSGILGEPDGNHELMTGHGDTGGASRFFTQVEWELPGEGDLFPVRYMAKAASKERPSYIAEDGSRVAHSTVKPLKLLNWLVTLVTPTGGIVLDPFTGSGTTIEAAIICGFDAVGVELTEEYLPLIEQRITRGYAGGPVYPKPRDAQTPADTGTDDPGVSAPSLL